MSIEFNCQACGKLLRVPDGSGGKQAKCPHCDSVMHIPEAGGGKAAAGSSLNSPMDPPPSAPSSAPSSTPSSTPSSQPAPTPPTPQANADELFGTGPGDDPLGIGDTPIEQKPQRSESIFDDTGATTTSSYGTDPYAGSTYPDTTGGYGGGANPYHSPQSTGYATSMGAAHRGGLVLTFGILSVSFSAFGSPAACGPVCCYVPVVFLLLGLGFGIPAWLMGQRDLRWMSSGQMDPSGHGTTKAGMITGMIGVILAVVCFVLCVVVSILMFLPSVMEAA